MRRLLGEHGVEVGVRAVKITQVVQAARKVEQDIDVMLCGRVRHVEEKAEGLGCCWHLPRVVEALCQHASVRRFVGGDGAQDSCVYHGLLHVFLRIRLQQRLNEPSPIRVLLVSKVSALVDLHSFI